MVESKCCTFVVGSTEQLWGAGAAIGLREGQTAGVLGVIAGRAQGCRQVRVVGVAVPVTSNGVPALARPPHVICNVTHKFSQCRFRTHLWGTLSCLPSCLPQHLSQVMYPDMQVEGSGGVRSLPVRK